MAKIDASKLKPGTLGKEVNAVIGNEASAVLIKGVVEEIIYAPETFDFETFKEKIEDPNSFMDVPSNSLLVRVISGKEYKNGGKLTLCHPLFPQHFQLPVKVGEHVFLFRYGKKISEDKLVDTMIYDGLIDAFNNYHMGVTAENVAEKFKITIFQNKFY